MSFIDALRYRLRVLLRRESYGRELDEELDHYVELESRAQSQSRSQSRSQSQSQSRSQSQSPSEDRQSGDVARRRAERSLGNLTYVREERRIVSGLALLDAIRQDVRFVIRVLMRRRVFAAVTIATLALGIGAATAIFSVADAVLFRPLTTLPRSDRIITIWQTRPALRANPVRAGQWDRGGLSLPAFRMFAATQTSFESVAAWAGRSIIVGGNDAPEELNIIRASASMLAVLGVSPELGRGFTPQEDDFGGERVALIGHEAWASRFGRDAHILGRRVWIDTLPYTIVGVLPAGITLDRRAPPPAFWIPAGQDAVARDAGANDYWAIGRLRDGVTLASATAETDMLMQSWPNAGSEKHAARLASLRDEETRQARAPILLLLAASALLLVIACANVATVLMGEAAARHRELSARIALGASRGRLLRQLLTESVVLAGISSVFGVALAYGGLKLIVRLAPPWIPGLDTIGVDGRVLTAALALTCVTGVLFGIVPAVILSRWRGPTGLRLDGQSRAGFGRSQRALVACEIALSMVLLVGAALLVQSFERINAVDLGFRRDQLLVVRFRLPQPQFADSVRLRGLYADLLARIRQLPGVVNVAATTTPPFSGGSSSSSFQIEGRVIAVGTSGPEAQRRVTTSDYFTTTGIPLIAGRSYSDADRLETAPVVVVSQSLARREWPNESAIGKRIKWIGQWRTIVGVVGDIKLHDLFESTMPTVYAPLAQVIRGADPSLIIRTRADAIDLAPTVRTIVREVAPSVPAPGIERMSDLISATLSDERFRTELISLFACIAGLLAVVGVYGVAATAASRRTREMAIRAALGARNASIVGLIVRAGAGGVGVGALVGVVLSLVGTRALRPYLYGVGTTDPWSYVSVLALLGATTLVATWIPARRATRIPLVETLRGD